jgi:hypothetical protein
VPDGGVTNGNAISVSKGTRADMTNSDVILNSTQQQTSPRTANRDCPGGPLVNRAPGGNWWGNRGLFGGGSNGGAISSLYPNTGLTEGSINSESYEFFHCCQPPIGSDDIITATGNNAENGATSSSEYAMRYRQRHTVSNVGSVPFGAITLNDLEPDDDPYLRKFRSCG